MMAIQIYGFLFAGRSIAGYFSGWFSIPAIASFPTESYKDTASQDMFNGSCLVSCMEGVESYPFDIL